MALAGRLLRCYSRLTPTGRGGYRLVRLARRLYAADEQRGWFRTPAGLEMHLDLGVYPDCTMAFGLYELETARLMRRLLRPGDHFVDGGANIGYFSLLAARRVGSAGRVDAFEPAPANRDRLLANVQRNGLDTIVRIHRFALADADGPARLHLPAAAGHTNHGRASLFDSGDAPAGDSVAVHSVRMDQVLAGCRPRLVKLDLEGAEPLAIDGMRRLLTGDHPPSLILEYNAVCARHAGFDPLAAVERARDLQPRYRPRVIGWRLRPLCESDPALRRGEANILLEPN